MEWVETTAKTVDEAKERALDQLGVVADEAEFEVVEEPRPGLFGRLRGEARVRARVRPAQVRPKQDRRRGRRERPADGTAEAPANGDQRGETRGDSRSAGRSGGRNGDRKRGAERPAPAARSTPEPTEAADQGVPMTEDTRPAEPAGEPVAIADVQAAAESFMGGLASAFGYDATVSSSVEDNEIEVRVDGESLGLLIGPGGRTLLSIQDQARVAAQRRLGDHDTRLRVDVSGYRQKRRAALERFAATVAEQVIDSGVARSLDPMPSADRKVLHDALAVIDGVSSRSEGEDPNRRIVVVPD